MKRKSEQRQTIIGQTVRLKSTGNVCKTKFHRRSFELEFTFTLQGLDKKSSFLLTTIFVVCIMKTHSRIVTVKQATP